LILSSIVLGVVSATIPVWTFVWLLPGWWGLRNRVQVGGSGTSCTGLKLASEVVFEERRTANKEDSKAARRHEARAQAQDRLAALGARMALLGRCVVVLS
jgi:hypothetical protein